MNEIKSLVSILMVCFNHKNFLEEAIESVFLQSYQNWEIIFVDDGSSDGSYELIKGYVDRYPNKIKLFIHENHQNRGIIESYKLGIANCLGEFIAFLEPDDKWGKDNLLRKINVLVNKNVNIVFSKVNYFGDESVLKFRDLAVKGFERFSKEGKTNIFKEILVNNVVPTFSTVISKRFLFNDVIFLNNRLHGQFLDWFFWIQISKSNDFYFIQERLVFWRFHENSLSFSKDNARDFIKEFLWEVKKRFLIMFILLNKERNVFLFFWIFFVFVRAFFLKTIFFIVNRLNYLKIKA